jgi:hypothetical protein
LVIFGLLGLLKSFPLPSSLNVRRFAAGAGAFSAMISVVRHFHLQSSFTRAKNLYVMTRAVHAPSRYQNIKPPTTVPQSRALAGGLAASLVEQPDVDGL